MLPATILNCLIWPKPGRPSFAWAEPLGPTCSLGSRLQFLHRFLGVPYRFCRWNACCCPAGFLFISPRSLIGHEPSWFLYSFSTRLRRVVAIPSRSRFASSLSPILGRQGAIFQFIQRLIALSLCWTAWDSDSIHG